MATSTVPLNRAQVPGAIQTQPLASATGGTAVPTSMDTLQTNPYAAPTATPGAAGTGLVPTTSTAGTTQTSPINWADGSNTVTGDFKDTYGAGTGKAITSVLSNLGTSTDSAVQALIANTNLEAGKQEANMQAGRAASGITPNSSAAALGDADFQATVNTGLQSTIANMENSEETELLQSLTNEGSAHGSDGSTLDSIMSYLSGSSTLLGAASGTASSLTSAINPSADTGALDALALL
jgi:hypothetical protein